MCADQKVTIVSSSCPIHRYADIVRSLREDKGIDDSTLSNLEQGEDRPPRPRLPLLHSTHWSLVSVATCSKRTKFKMPRAQITAY